MHSKTRKGAAGLAALSLSFLITACGGGDAPPAGDAPAAAAPGAASVPVVAQFEPIDPFIAEGSLTLRRSGDQVTADILADSHLGPGDYLIHIHEGTCAEGGRVVQALTTMTGGEGGEGTSLTTFAASVLSPTGTYFVQMHRSDGTPIACGNIPSTAGL